VPLSKPALESVTPLGSAPLSLKVGAGVPVAVTVNDPAVPTTNVVLLALVMVGAWLTVTVGEVARGAAGGLVLFLEAVANVAVPLEL